MREYTRKKEAMGSRNQGIPDRREAKGEDNEGRPQDDNCNQSRPGQGLEAQKV